MVDNKQSSKEFFNDVDRHYELLENEEYREVAIAVKNGTKLYLEIEVEDENMSRYLHKWLYTEKQRPFGCRLEAIHYKNPCNKELKQELLKIIEIL